jgi:UDP-N-acetylglucosamine:LPS N-acetylglucosamine transferase
MKTTNNIRILAIASAGGHWVQLRRLQPAWEGCHVIYVSTSESRRDEILNEPQEQGGSPADFYTVVEATRWEKYKLLKQFLQITKILLKARPHVVISTGAAPGFFALRVGKLLGARTIWVDSIANVESLSLSGTKAGSCADLWLTQWEHLAKSNNDKKNPHYEGSVI